ncbi:MAG: LpqB family beta-propeller domain-containing protein [Rhodoglobus sp.]
MSRRALAAAVAAVLSLALAGCVGIPTSGGVVAGPPINSANNGGFIPLANGPQAGASQEAILQDFITAANSPANDYQIAKLFLSDKLKSTWDPDNGVVVRNSTATISRVGDDALQYSATASAIVDATGVYKQLAQPEAQVRQYTFVQENGEWRIASAPDGIVLSQNSFDVVFDEHPLYFFDPSYQYLIPDVRWFPSRATIPLRMVNALLAGPTGWLQAGVVRSEFPAATSAKSVDIRSGTATIDLSGEASGANATQRDRMRQQLIATLSTLTTGISTVVMTVGGIPLQVPGTPAAIALQPAVEGSPLIGSADATPVFGFAITNGTVTAVPNLTTKIPGLAPIAVTLAADKRSAAVLGSGGVSVVSSDASEPLLIDDRSNLIAPSIDPYGFVWLAETTSAASLMTRESDGTPHPLQSNLPADAQIVAAKVSRDGARILLYVQGAAGPQLLVAGIIRDSGVPTGLGIPTELPVSAGAPIDATWVDNRTVAALYRLGETTLATAFELGGPTVALGDAGAATTIVGGNGIDGIRVLSDGKILRPQGSGGWQPTGLTASLLGTQQ